MSKAYLEAPRVNVNVNVTPIARMRALLDSIAETTYRASCEHHVRELIRGLNATLATGPTPIKLTARNDVAGEPWSCWKVEGIRAPSGRAVPMTIRASFDDRDLANGRVKGAQHFPHSLNVYVGDEYSDGFPFGQSGVRYSALDIGDLAVVIVREARQ